MWQEVPNQSLELHNGNVSNTWPLPDPCKKGLDGQPGGFAPWHCKHWKAAQPPWTGKHHENGICCNSFANIPKMPTTHPGNCQDLPGSSSHYESWWPVLTVGTKFEVQGENQWLCWPQPCAWINLGSTWDHTDHTYHLPVPSLIWNLAYKKGQKSGSDKSERPCFRGIWTVPFCPACQRWSVAYSIWSLAKS